MLHWHSLLIFSSENIQIWFYWYAGCRWCYSLKRLCRRCLVDGSNGMHAGWEAAPCGCIECSGGDDSHIRGTDSPRRRCRLFPLGLQCMLWVQRVTWGLVSVRWSVLVWNVLIMQHQLLFCTQSTTATLDLVALVVDIQSFLFYRLQHCIQDSFW